MTETWAQATGAYVTRMQAAGRAAGTVRLHRHYLRLLAEHAGGRGPWSLTEADLLAFMARPGWSPETRKSARSVVRCLYGWGYGTGRIEVDPAAGLPPVRVPPGRPRPAPEAVVASLVRGRDPRVALMAMLAAYAGLRAGEIARVHRRDLVGDELVVVGKGGKVRGIPVTDGRLLMRLRQVEGWAFPNGLGSHISAGHASRLLSRALPEGWTAHTLRHRMGTQAYAGTRDLLAVQQLLGHSRPETTQRYVLLPDDARRRAVEAASILAS